MIQLACRLNALFGRLGMSVSLTESPDIVTVATASSLCNMRFISNGENVSFEVELASPADIKSFLLNVGDNFFSEFSTEGNVIKISRHFEKPLAAAGWLVGEAIKVRQAVDKMSEFLSVVGDTHRKLLIRISPEIGKMIDLKMATDKLPESHSEGQRIIGRHRYTLSGEGFRADSRLLYMIDLTPLVEVFDGSKNLFSSKLDIGVTDNKKLSLTRELKIYPLPSTVTVERAISAEPVELKYEIFLEPNEVFDISKLKVYENNESEFDPDCYDGLSVGRIVYGEQILDLQNPDNYFTCLNRLYYFGTLYPDYIEYINV